MREDIGDDADEYLGKIESLEVTCSTESHNHEAGNA